MPELPELQAHAERLAEAYLGVPLERFEPLSFTALKTYTPDPGKAAGCPLETVGRRGKFLLLGFGELTFVVHLMQGGRLRPDPKLVRKPRNGVARWRFADGHDALLLTEAGTEHKAGVWVVGGEPLAQAPLDDLGPEADELDAEGWQQVLAGRSARLHTVLRDQHAVAGLGRRLANEICHRAALSPFANSKQLGPDDVVGLAGAARACLDEGLADERVRAEMSASKDRPAAVHHRTGEPCPACGEVVREVAYRGYTVHYCATCQTGGKVLADNTTSKFLK